jgi:hypothetical protein
MAAMPAAVDATAVETMIEAATMEATAVEAAASESAMRKVPSAKAKVPVMGDVKAAIPELAEALRMPSEGPSVIAEATPMSPAAVTPIVVTPIVAIPIMMTPVMRFFSPPSAVPSGVPVGGIFSPTVTVGGIAITSVISGNLYTSSECKRSDNQRYEAKQL